MVVGPESALAISTLAGARYSWCGKAPNDPTEWFDTDVQVRAHGDTVPSRARLENDELVIELLEPLIGVAPGQTAVLYQGTRVLGQTTIDRTESAVSVG